MEFTDSYTMGKLYIDGEYFCDTIEDTNRDLNKNGTFDNGETKVYGETCIPFGTYSINLDTISPKFSKYPFYMEVCEGKLPRLLNVPFFDGILIHVADGPKGAKLVQGCIGIGTYMGEGQLCNGKPTFRKLYSKLKEHKLEPIIIEII